MRILISGASGLIGRRLSAFLSTGGHAVETLGRHSGIRWDPEAGQLDEERLEGFDAVVHLAGENVGGGRWTDERKRKIMDSRVKGTALLAGALSRRQKPPRVLVSASAVGYYGAHAAGVVDEGSPPGDDFLARVCVAWEAAATVSFRLVHPRFGVVLSTDGGALQAMLTPFRAGLGGPIGGGKQPFPWVDLDDAVAAVWACISDETLSGPVNVVAPERLTQADFAHALGHALGRPSFVPLPAFAVKLLFGEMGETVLLGGVAVAPAKLVERGFVFAHATLDDALRHMLTKA